MMHIKRMALAALLHALLATGTQPHAAHLRRGRSSHYIPPPPPALYTAWKPDPNELKDVLSGKLSLLNSNMTHRHRRHNGTNATDEDDFELPASMFKPVVPKQTFKMPESATILYGMLGEFGKPTYLEFAAKTAKEYNLSNATKAQTVLELKHDLEGFKLDDGKDYMLSAAAENFPKISAKERRTRMVKMLEVMLANATNATPPGSVRHVHSRKHQHTNRTHS